MIIGRNDSCHCGSNKKYKRCCLVKEEISNPNVKLNTGLSRKYMSEFALHTYSSEVTICYPTDLKHLKERANNYHIYMINEIPKLSIIRESIQIHTDHIKLTIQIGLYEPLVKEVVSFSIYKGDHSKFTFELNPNNKEIIFRDNYGGGIQTNVLTLLSEYTRSPIDNKILYIGQSYGKSGNRNAVQRLMSHSTLQEVLADTLMHKTDVEIAITLWEFTPRLISNFDGRRKKFLKSSEEDLAHLTKVLSAPPLRIDNQIINITEAALINYFKPHYNEMFKNNFPDIKHKGYSFYFDYDYNAICVELDPGCININIFSESTNYYRYRPIKYLLDSEESRMSMFDITFN